METIVIIGILVVLICISSSIGAGIYFSQKSESESEPKSKPESEPKSEPLPKIWKQSGQSKNVGGNGGYPQSMICKENAFVTQFSGGSGNLMDRIGIKCSDGTSLGPFGGGGGNVFVVENTKGFDKLITKSSDFVNNIRFYDNGTELKKVGGDGGGGPTDLACDGGKIMGLNLRTGQLVDSIQVVCATQQ
jgi:hypothetical protein